MGEPLPKTSWLPPVRGKYKENAPLGAASWFRAGGTADVLFRPADREDLAQFLKGCPAEVPVMTVGVMSNIIVRDGGVRGVVVRLGGEFAETEVEDQGRVIAGAAALDASVAAAAARAGVGGVEFLCGVPGTIGGALRMNAGAYGKETSDVLVEAEAVDRQGQIHRLRPRDMGMSYRHTLTPEGYIFTGCVLQGAPDNRETIEARMAMIRDRRADSQPIRERTGGSTFANPSPEELAAAGVPEGTKAWQLIEKAGCRGFRIGDAMMSEKHCNFMINAGQASAAELEQLGEQVRARVLDGSGISLRWEIKRIGEALAPDSPVLQ